MRIFTNYIPPSRISDFMRDNTSRLYNCIGQCPFYSSHNKKNKKKSAVQDIVFLDYNTNCDVFDFSKPLSHAALVKLYIEDNYPCIETYQEWKKTDGQNEPKGKKVRSSNKQEYGQLDLFQ